MPHDLPKAYEPGSIELRWAEYWVQHKLFHVETPAPGSKQPTFTLTLPPPNVTGRLHMGHMLNQTEMDIIVRWHRMRGFLTLWLPGTDHAGIATQVMVERQLAAEGKNRRDIGRETFMERVWAWKKQYGGAILEQMKRLGASVDWSREFFTMSPELSRAVREAFVRLYEEGLIYRGKYIVNWCPRCTTAVSDLEVIHEETPGKLYEIRYPVVGSSDEFIVVATTRPETMLGDTAVAVNSGDERYRHLHGKKVLLPLMNREIPIVTDDLLANPEFGTGAVKVTPSHDPNDFEAGLRNQLPQIEVMNDIAQMNENAGPYAGLDRFEARQNVLQDLEAGGFLVSTKDYTVPLGTCSRCHTIVEPRLSEQWFVKIQPLADRAIEAVEQGEIKFVPENYTKTYFEWMRNIHDWCISRQLWWGHRIPAWYCRPCGELIVAREAPSLCSKCGSATLEQDNDVLDTWFSSGLLPCSALGWPDQTPELEAFYPTSLLITAFDILFFWVARMIMMNCHFMRGHKHGDVPFRTVYIHALVRDAERQKMSKTKGNVIDPIEITEKYGTDAVRFALASSAAPGTDIAFSDDKVQSYRAFANKIWNAGRFILMNLGNLPELAVRQLGVALEPIPEVGFDALPVRSSEFGVRGLEGHGNEQLRTEQLRTEQLLIDRWIFSRLAAVTHEMNEALAGYRFHEAAHTIYHFFWHEFCDWYLEWVKPEITERSDEPRPTAAWVNMARAFEAALHLLHPFMPFITEELWHQLPHSGNARSISLTRFELVNPQAGDVVSEKQFETLRELIVAARNVKAEMGLQKEKPSAQVATEDLRILEIFRSHQHAILRLAGLEALNFARGRLPAEASPVPLSSGCDLRLFYERPVDVVAERTRLEREIPKAKQQLERIERQLANESFRSRAPQDVVTGAERRRAELVDQFQRLEQSLARLGAAPSSPQN